MRNFVKTNRGTPKDPVVMSTNTAELPVRGHRPDGCHKGPLVAYIRFVCLASFRAGFKIMLHPSGQNTVIMCRVALGCCLHAVHMGVWSNV